MDKNMERVSQELSLKAEQVRAASELLDSQATVPFIARYRKEATGGLDEVAIIAIRDRMEELREMDRRRESILKSLQDQEKLTPLLEKEILEAATLAKLEDIYLPYRPKRRTRAAIAREKGLEPLADLLFAQECSDPVKEASAFVDAERGVADANEALQGARDIIAERISENAGVREEMRALFNKKASFSSRLVKSKESEAANYRDYFEYNEPADRAPSHRILAMFRGVEEGFLSLHILPEEEEAIRILEQRFVRGDAKASEQVRIAAADSYSRLLAPSMENELWNRLKKKADEEAIKVFAENVRELLLAPPLGQKRVLAVDPGLRTGCKIVTLSAQGALLHHDTIYPLEPHNKRDEAARKVCELCEKFAIQAIAVGNGTGGREALAFLKSIGLSNVLIAMVNESGASVYSASETARTEFPDKDVTVRGAVSIGRRLMDPLAELVKIDPKSIGVGQYQHDVDQKELKRSLDDVVMSCVNSVGVEVNTASGHLLRYVSGLSSRLADAIVKHRDANGPFKSRSELACVPGMGPKTYEQAAGFLRIHDAENPLDASAVHPESYHIVERMAADLGCGVRDLIAKKELRDAIKLEVYVSDSAGLPTLRDIRDELAKPGRDPRREFESFTFAEGINEISDLERGMRLTGVVTNVTAFGAFVDIGVHQDGLVHVSHLSDSYISNPHSVVKVGQQVNVTVLEVDTKRRRISLSMKENLEGSPAARPKHGDEKPRIFSENKGKAEKNKSQTKDTKAAKGAASDNPFSAFGRKWKDEHMRR